MIKNRMLDNQISLKQLREDNNYSRKYVSNEIGISEYTLYLYETDINKFSKMTLDTFIKFIVFYDIDVFSLENMNVFNKE